MARDYTHIQDIIHGIQGAINLAATISSPLYQTYNLGNDSPVTLLQLIKVIESVSHKKCILTFQDAPLGDVPITHADISMAKADFGYSPKITLKEGIESMYPWIRSLYS